MASVHSTSISGRETAKVTAYAEARLRFGENVFPAHVPFMSESKHL